MFSLFFLCVTVATTTTTMLLQRQFNDALPLEKSNTKKVSPAHFGKM